MEPLRPLLTTQQAAEVLSVSPSTVKRLRASGGLVGRQIGRQWRYTAGDVLAYIEKSRALPSPQAPTASRPRQATGNYWDRWLGQFLTSEKQNVYISFALEHTLKRLHNSAETQLARLLLLRMVDGEYKENSASIAGIVLLLLLFEEIPTGG